MAMLQSEVQHPDGSCSVIPVPFHGLEVPRKKFSTQLPSKGNILAPVVTHMARNFLFLCDEQPVF